MHGGTDGELKRHKDTDQGVSFERKGVEKWKRETGRNGRGSEGKRGIE